jgi:hypothetical protein
MTNIRIALRRARGNRSHLRQERALQQALADAPTLETAHEIAAISARG